MRIYDITQELFSCHVYPGDLAPSYRRVSDMEKGAVCNITELSMNAHNGTHVDAPRHFVKDGISIEALDLSTLIGPCTVAAFQGGITRDMLLSYRGTERLLAKGDAWLTVEKTSGGAIKDGLSDDLYDLTIDHIGAGQANTTELCLNHAMYDVQLSDETLAKLCEQGFDYVTVPAGTWNGQNEEIKTVGSQQCIIVSADMDEQVAYNIIKALCENREILVNTSAVLANFDPAVAGSKALTGCELHPGAAKYYEEMGYAHN